MKYLRNIPVLIFFLSAFLSNAQKAEEIKESFWGAEDPQKNNTTVPEKWKNESAVILLKEHFYDYHKFNKKVKYSHSLRQRIKLQDQAAVKEHSEFSFTKKFRVKRGWGKTGVNHIGMKIIKPDGTEKEVPVDEEAVKTDDEFKLAISGLEVGDILDYYIYTIEPFTQKYGYEFEPITRILSDEYPIAEMILRFNTENDFFINFNTYNGAPALKEIPTDHRNDRRYVLKAENLEKYDFPIWYFPQNELPYYKFQVTFARRGQYENDIFNYLPEQEDIIKKQVTQEEVQDLYQRNWGRSFKKSRYAQIEKYLRDKNLSDREKIIEAYHYFRHYYLTQFVEPSVFVEAKLIPGHTVAAGSGDYIFAIENLSFMAGFLDYCKIPFNRIIAVPRNAGTVQDLLYRTEATELLEVPLSDGPLYIPALNLNSDINGIDYMLENTEAYALKYTDNKGKIRAVETIKTKTSTYKDNGTKTLTQIRLSDDFDRMQVEKTTNSMGHTKTSAQKDALVYFDYVDEDHDKYDNPKFVEAGIRMKKNRERVGKEAAALKNKLGKKRSDYLEEQLENELEFEVDDYSMKIESTGRYGAKSPFVLSETFTMPDNLIKRAGRNYLLEISKLIGGQVSLEEEEKKRSSNIYMPFPRSFENTIELKIPEGYSVNGLNKLNKQVENQTGGFTSQAEVTDGILKIHTFKYYKNYYEPHSNWGKMVDFLDAAYQFTQEKIMLKKESGTTR